MASRNLEARSLAQFVSEHLDARADAITEQWLGALLPEIELQASPNLPSSRLCEQIPGVVRSVAEFARSPIELARSEVVHRLRLHAERRREQGYDILARRLQQALDLQLIRRRAAHRRDVVPSGH